MNTDIDELLTSWAESERTGDADRLDRLLADDFVGIGPVGFMLAKDAWLSRFAQGLRYDRLELDEVSARRYGDAAIVVARQHAVGEHQGNPIPADTRVSFMVLLADGDGPRIAAIQYSFMAPLPATR
jgi:ketosteroid isomerase-like protein